MVFVGGCLGAYLRRRTTMLWNVYGDSVQGETRQVTKWPGIVLPTYDRCQCPKVLKVLFCSTTWVKEFKKIVCKLKMKIYLGDIYVTHGLGITIHNFMLREFHSIVSVRHMTRVCVLHVQRVHSNRSTFCLIIIMDMMKLLLCNI